MKLKSLKLENFRQHEDSYIDFSDGITVINGTNGSGKTTILEAISWAIYGTEAARGNKDTIKFNKAKAKAKVRVELIFSLDDEEYKIERYLDKAELYAGSNPAPIVTSQQEVTKYLIDKLGMTKEEFFNTYFTGQKELNFLGNQKPLERRKFISKVLNYEKIREVQEQARADKNALNNEINWLKSNIANLETLEEEKILAEAELKTSSQELEALQKEFAGCSLELAKIEPEREKLNQTKQKFEKNSQEIVFLKEKKSLIEKNISNLTEKIKIFDEKSKKLSAIGNIEQEYKQTELKIKENEALQEKDAIRQTLSTKIELIEKEIAQKTFQQEEVTKSGKEKRLIVDKIPSAKTAVEEISAKISKLEAETTSELREKEVLISQKQLEIEKIKKQLSLINEKGENGVCPTCERALKGEFEKVTSNFKSHISILDKEIAELLAAKEKLANKNAEIADLKREKQEKDKEYACLMNFQGGYEEERSRYKILSLEIKAKTDEKEILLKELDNLPKGFDIEAFKKIKEVFQSLRSKYEQFLSLSAELKDFDNLKTELAENQKAKTEIETSQTRIEKELAEMKYSEEGFKKTEESYQQVKEGFYNLKNKIIQAENTQKNSQEKLDRVKKAEAENKEKLKEIKEKQERTDLLSELDRFYGQFWEKLNNQARPEISELAGKFLVDLTDGRYTELELNDKYELCLHDDGEIKPVISGGEEDIVNLCVRLAISQIIANRSGKTLSLLILDEIFGSLDENRRNNVVNLLRNLTNSFEQVILITHIEDIKDEIDNIITIEYDAEKGCSKIKES